MLPKQMELDYSTTIWSRSSALKLNKKNTTTSPINHQYFDADNRENKKKFMKLQMRTFHDICAMQIMPSVKLDVHYNVVQNTTRSYIFIKNTKLDLQNLHTLIIVHVIYI